MILLLVLILLGLLLLAALFSASEVALFSLPAAKVKAFKTDTDPRQRLVARLLESPRDLLVTVLMINIGISILVQNVTASLFGSLSGWYFNIGVPLLLTLVVGDILPKSIGLAHNTRIARRVAPFLYQVRRFLLPVRRVLIAITSVVSKVLFFFLQTEEDISAEELHHALKTSKHQGVLNADEAELIRGYLTLREAQVKEVMRPREEVLYYELSEPLSKLLHLFVDRECSRLPVYEETLDNIQGIITSRSYFLYRDQLRSPQDLIPFLEKPFFVHEGMDAEMLLEQMHERKELIAIVVDEYGSISGLITLEDLVEKVIGEIADARDVKSRFTRSGADVIIASGKMELSELDDVFGVMLHSENNMVTVGGWLIEQLGEIPKTGSKHTMGGFFFHVLSADAKRIRRLYIRHLKASAGAKGR